MRRVPILDEQPGVVPPAALPDRIEGWAIKCSDFGGREGWFTVNADQYADVFAVRVRFTPQLGGLGARESLTFVTTGRDLRTLHRMLGRLLDAGKAQVGVTGPGGGLL